MSTQKRLFFPNVKKKFEGKFPQGHVNSLMGWDYPHEELKWAATNGRMLTMDLDMGGEFSCRAKCRHCFEKKLFGQRKKAGTLLSDGDVLRVLAEAKELGLRSVKIIGPGEPIENKSLFNLIDMLQYLGIKTVIFTKGTAIGDDDICWKTHGFKSGELIRRIDRYTDRMGIGSFQLSIALGSNSFYPKTQDDIVRWHGYSVIRNRAIERLVDACFTDFVPGKPTRLGIIMNPIMRENADEIFETYAWARERHIYVITSPTMVSGPCAKESVYRKMTPETDKLLDLYVKINLWAIERGIFSLEDLERDGISAYAGAKPCQQVGAGLFIRRDGIAFRCPGDDTSIQGNLHRHGLAEIWKNSENLNRYGGMINVGCPPKEGKSIPDGFLQLVLREIKSRLSGTEAEKII